MILENLENNPFNNFLLFVQSDVSFDHYEIEYDDEDEDDEEEGEIDDDVVLIRDRSLLLSLILFNEISDLGDTEIIGDETGEEGIDRGD